MPTNITIKNTNQRNQIKVSTEKAETDSKTKKVDANGNLLNKPELVWKPSVTTYLKPGEFTDVWVGEAQRISVVEMPT